MRKIARILLFFLLPVAVQAQTIALGPITKLVYCVGDTLEVPYTATGNFAGDNHFFVQLSDAEGSFQHSTALGNNAALIGSLGISLNAAGTHFRVRVASSDPFDTSSNNGQDLIVSLFPSPSPSVIVYRGAFQGLEKLGQSGGQSIGTVGFVGDYISFFDENAKLGASAYLWKFDSTATPSISTDSAPQIMFAKDGVVYGSLTTTNPSGCSKSFDFQFAVLTCDPTIPANSIVVTSEHTGSQYDAAVWVKAGGTYVITTGSMSYLRIFVEAGGTLKTGDGTSGVCYLKDGASIAGSFSPVVLPRDYGQMSGDTFCCPSLAFDYSLVSRSVADAPSLPPISIHQTADHLIAHADGQPISLRLVSVLGEVVLTLSGEQDLDVDLSSLPAGVYFAEVRAGGRREVRRVIR